MKAVLRVVMSILGSIALSALASWALRRLLLWSAGGGEQDEKRSAPVIVVMPIMAGNQWVFGQPRQTETPSASTSETGKANPPVKGK